MRKKILILLSLVLALLLPTKVSAHEVPDLQAGGTVTVTLHTTEEAANTGSLTFYHVAEIQEENGNYSYVLTEAFRPSGLSLEDPTSPDLAQGLAQYVSEQHLSGETRKIENGTVVYSVPAGKLGLYLVVQQEPCTGYEAINPFVIGVPEVKDGSFLYDVDAAPKMGDLIPSEPTEPSEPSEPSEPTEPTEPDIPHLPQTGQLNWPVPVLAAAGMILFSVGWVLSNKGKEKNVNEN